MRQGTEFRFLDSEDVEVALTAYLDQPWPASDYAGRAADETACPVTMALQYRYPGSTIANTKRGYVNFHSPQAKVSGARVRHTTRIERFVWRLDAQIGTGAVTFARARAIWEGTTHGNFS